jgi:hypothetical protein
MTPSAEQVRIEGDHRPPAQRPTSVGARKRVSGPAQPTRHGVDSRHNHAYAAEMASGRNISGGLRFWIERWLTNLGRPPPALPQSRTRGTLRSSTDRAGGFCPPSHCCTRAVGMHAGRDLHSYSDATPPRLAKGRPLRGLRASRRPGEGRGRHEARDVREFRARRGKRRRLNEWRRVMKGVAGDARPARSRIRSSGARLPALGVS